MWRYTKDNKLENKSGPWKHDKKSWRIPHEGDHAHAGFIKDQQSGLVLGLVAQNSANEMSEVILQNVNQDDPFGQKWRRSKANADGWFTFLNPGNNQFLSIESVDGINASGNNYN